MSGYEVLPLSNLPPNLGDVNAVRRNLLLDAEYFGLDRLAILITEEISYHSSPTQDPVDDIPSFLRFCGLREKAVQRTTEQLLDQDIVSAAWIIDCYNSYGWDRLKAIGLTSGAEDAITEGAQPEPWKRWLQRGKELAAEELEKESE